jgi:CPA2 family monovalent cation:H+ antiporter-2
MQEFDFLKSLEIIFIASAAVVFLLHKLKIPSLVGFLVAGVIIGPYGVGIVRDTHAVEMMAEIGVILLLFTVGIEFSMAKLVRMKKAVVVGGGVQVVLTIVLSALAAYLVTSDTNKSLFFGFLIALSSTAIVMKILAEKGETDSPHGRLMVGVLLFQDLCVVPLMLLVPVLSGEGISAGDVLLKMGKAALIVTVVLLSARWIVPGLLHQVVHTRSRELFVTTIILLCLGIALLTARFGLSFALGAFLAGMIISESEYAHQATSDILPFKDSFIGLFFVSIGMLMNIGYMLDNFSKITIVVAAIFGAKILTGVISGLSAGNPLRVSIHAGLGLFQIGEFSFVLAIAGRQSGLITDSFYQVFLSSSVVTMMVTPFVLKGAPSVAGWIASRRLIKRALRFRRVTEGEGFPRKKQKHVIIVGFGLNGRNLARVLKKAGIPYVVLEMNSDTVREMRKKGEPVYYGDGTSKEILHKLSVDRAKLLVVAISDPASTRRIVSVARHENPELYIIVRTRYLAEVDDLKALGADEVIPEEFETSVEIFSRVLHKYNFPRSVIMEMVDKIRSDSYTALRSVEIPRTHLFDEVQWLPEIEIDGYRIPDGSGLVDKNIGALQIRKKTGGTVIAVRRGPDVFINPASEFAFRAGDIILFTGERKSMENALNYFKSEEKSSPVIS